LIYQMPNSLSKMILIYGMKNRRGPLQLTYTFLNTYPSYYKTSIFDLTPNDINILGDFTINPGTIALDPAQIVAMRALLTGNGDFYRASFSDVTNVSFAEIQQTGSGINQSGDITYSRATMKGTNGELGFEYSQNDALGAIDKSGIVIDDTNPSLVTDLEEGQRGLHNLLHETGHSLGLGDVSKTILNNTSLDNQKYSVMSYKTFNSLQATNLMLLDVAALQAKYGRDYSTRETDTTYSKNNVLFDTNNASGAVLYTIWDGAGVDKIDASDFIDRVQIDLRQGHFSSIGKYSDGRLTRFDNDPLGNDPDSGRSGNETAGEDPQTGEDIPDNNDHGNIAIAFHAVIENAVGTNDILGGDILIGNAWGNRIEGLGGDDYLYGSGLDYDGDEGFTDIDANDPNDPNRTKPVSDDDTFVGGEGADKIFGGSGSDTADYSRDASMGGAGAVTVTLDNNGDGTAIDGFGDTDSLRSIENIIGTSSNDTFNLQGPSGRVIDGGGGTDDKVNYIQSVIEGQECPG
jgi:serralysin